MERKQREGVLVKPHNRLTQDQIDLVDEVSRELLEEPGLLCYNDEAAALYSDAGANVEQAESEGCKRVSLPSTVIDKALESAPSKVTLGARNPDNRLILDAHEPRSRFGSGSETNVWLDVDFENGHPKFTRKNGSIDRLCKAAHLCDNLENLDFFIRCVNIQDEEVNSDNKDVNKYLASLNNITKHVQAGLTNLDHLDDVMKLGQIIAGGKDEFQENPVLSFITCVIKSPLQVVEDTADKLIAIARRGAPVVISSSPMGGATAPFDEFGMVAQINAEILAGVTLNQLASPGAPVLYGSVPVRTRLDTLDDMYGAPEFNLYNLDCTQMARHYGLPCYSTAGVADSSVPGIQATAEKMLTYVGVPPGGAQYIHYAFGLLERTNVFCPVQAVMDDAHIGMVKHMLHETNVHEGERDRVLNLIRDVMDTPHKTYMYHLPLPTQEDVYVSYPLESDEGDALHAANEKYHEILSMDRNQLPDDIQEQIKSEVPGVLPRTLQA